MPTYQSVSEGDTVTFTGVPAGCLLLLTSFGTPTTMLDAGFNFGEHELTLYHVCGTEYIKSINYNSGNNAATITFSAEDSFICLHVYCIQ